MGINAPYWVYGCVFSGIPFAQIALANCLIFIVQGAVLDAKHHPHDFLDPVFLGRNGIANQTLLSWGFVDEPLEWLLFSDFSMILAFGHLYTLFMKDSIFN